MTNANTLSLRSFDIPSIHKFTVGFDNIFDELHRATVQQANNPGNYPPYNIVKHDDDHFDIELAVAGFRQGDISLTVEKNILTIKGEQTQDLGTAQPDYLYRGISARNFARTFTLAEHVEVLDASSEDGILTVKLERKVPDEQKPKSIAISYKK
jgi:molecular chaperone IbpA